MSRPPHLVRRFALYAGLALGVAALSAFFFVRHYATHRAEQTATSNARFIAGSILQSRLRHSDFSRPVRGARLGELDRLARNELLHAGAVRVKLYRPDGLVVYSSDHGLIGTRTPEADEIAEAVGGSSISDVTMLDAEGGTAPNSKVLESYVPVRIGGRPAGVFELYTDYAPIARDARSIFLPLAGGIALVLLGLYLSFFPILKRATRTLQRQMEQIRHKAYYDSLTDLPNRALFKDRIDRAVRDARATGARLAILLIDLDRFKEINDSLGHRSGDLLLAKIGRELDAQMRAGDTVARLGGDEFGILAVGIGDPSAVLALAERVRGILARSHLVDGAELEVDASVGVALYPDHGGDVETLVRHADVAMYRSKEVHAPALYEREHDHHSARRLALLAELRGALANRELIVEYQPQCDPADGELRSVEALVRWQHPVEGLLMPGDFVPPAEHTGLIRLLSNYVLDTALQQCAAWEREGLATRVAVNIGERDLLDCSLPDQVAAALDHWGVEPDRLELEITESTVLVDPSRTVTILGRLRSLGVSVAIDDFGTGSSSLAYLRSLPVDVLKIDRSFVTHMLDSREDEAIVRSTIQLAHGLGLRVVAEGVENEALAATLAELGCDLGQGHYFGRAAAGARILDAHGRHAVVARLRS